MPSEKPETIYLKDYAPPVYLVDAIDLSFDLREEDCLVNSRLKCRLNPRFSGKDRSFVAYGRDMELIAVNLDNETLDDRNYKINEESLTIPEVPEEFTLKIRTRIQPQNNTSLEGLYKSRDMFCTQCEPEGFRKITYFPDRPDVMSVYSATIIADRDLYPVLLSNGNPAAQGELSDNRHWVKWEDPSKKPSYLFALVAGNLAFIEDQFTTCSGRKVVLRIYTEKENIDKCDYAMSCLKRAMKWDEEVYQREYDLDIFMIAAVNDFNMGAMENKGLNIFNSTYILARPETASDANFQNIQGVIAHEYFHNWSGNRVTCRDWFQLSLKEGFTIFRDQQFSEDMISGPVKRIEEVKYLKTVQFAEDSGPMAHQVRPDSYVEINNFYTPTIYQKGAEIIRMTRVLLGEENFHKGALLYFERHDGQAVAIEDFVKAMEDASGEDLTRLRLWYSQAGTPEVSVETNYDSKKKTFDLTLRQFCPPTPGQPKKQPFHIPVVAGLLDARGEAMTLNIEKERLNADKKEVRLNFLRAEQKFTFADVPEKPTLSILRGFSAPVKIKREIDEEEALFLVANDKDEFCRWDAAQTVTTRLVLRLIEKYKTDPDFRKNPLPTVAARTDGLTAAFKKVLSDDSMDKAFAALLIAIPSELYIAEQMAIVDPEAIRPVRDSLKTALALSLEDTLFRTYHDNDSRPGEYSVDPASVGRRSLKNTALGYLMSTTSEEAARLCLRQHRLADNMTDEISALTFLADKDSPERIATLETFRRKWENDPLVMNIWLSAQASSKLSRLKDIKKLARHPVFEWTNPNKLRALIGTFCQLNFINFHREGEASYQFLADQVLKLDKVNPLMAARLLNPLTRWRRFDAKRQNLIKSRLKRILQTSKLSKDVYEVASKSLK